jgi:hypothetical protein
VPWCGEPLHAVSSAAATSNTTWRGVALTVPPP